MDTSKTIENMGQQSGLITIQLNPRIQSIRQIYELQLLNLYKGSKMPHVSIVKICISNKCVGPTIAAHPHVHRS